MEDDDLDAMLEAKAKEDTSETVGLRFALLLCVCSDDGLVGCVVASAPRKGRGKS
jgi:hypothetical protein